MEAVAQDIVVDIKARRVDLEAEERDGAYAETDEGEGRCGSRGEGERVGDLGCGVDWGTSVSVFSERVVIVRRGIRRGWFELTFHVPVHWRRSGVALDGISVDDEGEGRAEFALVCKGNCQCTVTQML